MEEDKTLKNIMDDDFGKIILKIRKEKNLTQKELADLINVSDRTISKWENGQSVPDLICIKNICKSLGISPSSLVLDKKSKKEHISDIYNKIGKFLTIKRIINIIIFAFLIFLLIFYLNNRNTVTIYKLKLASDDIYMRDGYIINTKYKNIIVINDLKLNRNEEYSYINVELYTFVNGDKVVIYSKNDLDNIYVDEFHEENNKKRKDIISSLSKDLHISISINNNIYDEKISVVEKYQNNSIVNSNSLIGKEDSELAINNYEVKNNLVSFGYNYDYMSDTYYKDNSNYRVVINPNGGNIMIQYENTRCALYYLRGIVDYVEYNNEGDKKIELQVFQDKEKSNICKIGKCKKSYPIIDEILKIYEEIKDIL